MNKDKLTDRRDNNIENKKEDYKDGNGNPEEFIEDMTDPEATAIFKEAFYTEGKALEEEALRSSFVEDEEEKEALRLRILATAGRSTEGTSAADGSVDDDAVASRSMTAATFDRKEIDATAENSVLEHKVALENRSSDAVDNKAVAQETVTEHESGDTMTASKTPVRNNDAVKAPVEAVKKKKKRTFTPFMRWAAVLALVCVGVFGVSVTGQAKGSGLWSSIQRLIGGETRWEQDNNGEDRTYTSTEEEKAIREIEEKLGIDFPIFFYWPGEIGFKDAIIYEESQKFVLEYVDDEQIIYFEGGRGDNDSSANNVWQGEGQVDYVEYDGITYTITELKNDIYGVYYNTKWSSGENIYLLSGIRSREDLEKILKNIKN